VADEAGPADLVSGLGMLGGTNHRRLDIFYQLQAVEAPAPPDDPQPVTPPDPAPTPPDPQPVTPPDPEPVPGPPPDSAEWWQELSDKLDRIIELLERRLE
jgi:hypothetical protein